MAKVIKVKGSRNRRAHTRKVKVATSYDLDFMYANKGKNGFYTPNPNLGHSSFNTNEM